MSFPLSKGDESREEKRIAGPVSASFSVEDIDGAEDSVAVVGGWDETSGVEASSMEA